MPAICRYPGITLQIQPALSNSDLMDVVAKSMLDSGVAPETVAEYVRSVHGKSWDYTFEASQAWIKITKVVPAPVKAERPMFANIQESMDLLGAEDDEEYAVLVERHNGKDGELEFWARVVVAADPRISLYAAQHEEGDLPPLLGKGPTMVAALVALNKVCEIKGEKC